jgi:hypothetical protein
LPKKTRVWGQLLFWNDVVRDALAFVTPVPARVLIRRASCREEQSMRKSILAMTAIAFAIAAPIAAQAQSDMTTGVSRGGSVVVEGIDQEHLPAFREYVIRERIPNHTITERAIVGTVLPDEGVTFYDVPQTYGPTPYRYTIVNGSTVLVEPRTRRIVQVIE